MNHPPCAWPVPGSCPPPPPTRTASRSSPMRSISLAQLRTPYWLGDSAVQLHALASLIAQAEQLLPEAVHDARDQELTWTQIGELLSTTATTAARRYQNKP